MIKFKPGQLIEIRRDSVHHGLKLGSQHIVENRYDDSSFEVKIKNGFLRCKVIVNDQDATITDINEINAEIQAALDPHAYTSLTEFNRVSNYGGGGVKHGKFMSFMGNAEL